MKRYGWRAALQVLVRWLVATVGVWTSSAIIHSALPQVPELPLLAALGVCTMVRALAFGAGDLIKSD